MEKLCPDGVEYKELGEVCEFNRGKSITSKIAIDGDVPVISGGKKPAFYHNVSNRNSNCITVAGSGVYAGFINFWDIPIFCADSFSVDVRDFSLMNVKYIYYFLKDKQNLIYSFKKGAGIAHVYGKDLSKIKIPIPPIEIQEEIVRILDKFTELTAREKQYKHYRDSLLTFGDDVEWKKLAEICVVSNGKDHKKLNNGNIPVYGSGGVMRHVDEFIYDRESVLIPRKGSISNIFYVNFPFWVVDTIFYTKIGDFVIPKYLYYFLKTIDLLKLNIAAGVPSLTKQVLNEILIPIPPLSEQERIVSILDKFDGLCNDISIGLPAEIDFRKKQYEYYREKLLNFRILSKN